MNKKELQAYSDAWNAHDIDKIMAFMTEDCVFEPGCGMSNANSIRAFLTEIGPASV